MNLPTQREREGLRESFRPKRIRILFIGEAPPASGRFFYSANSGLYRAMRDAFIAVCPRTDDENFLDLFQASGCYLTDLYPKPVDHLNEKLRRRARILGEEILSEQLIRLRPEKIAPVLRVIRSHVEKAALRAHWHGQIIKLPYPGRWHRHRVDFLKALAPTLQQLLCSRRTADPRSVSQPPR